VHKAVYERVAKISKVIKEDFEGTTETWDHDVKFYRRVWTTHKTVGFVVNTADEIYRYVTEGTEAHWITAKNFPYLHFWVGGGYPKTKPGVLKPGKGAHAKEERVSKKRVWHPGTEARKFAEYIHEKRDKEITKGLQNAIRFGLAATGHLW